MGRRPSRLRRVVVEPREGPRRLEGLEVLCVGLDALQHLRDLSLVARHRVPFEKGANLSRLVSGGEAAACAGDDRIHQRGRRLGEHLRVALDIGLEERPRGFEAVGPGAVHRQRHVEEILQLDLARDCKLERLGPQLGRGRRAERRQRRLLLLVERQRVEEAHQRVELGPPARLEHQLVHRLLVLGRQLIRRSDGVSHKSVEPAARLGHHRLVQGAEGGQHADQLAAQLAGEVAVGGARGPAELGQLSQEHRACEGVEGREQLGRAGEQGME
mmetsp:Transcript_5709/g.18168  ORF Transcript_5709/g.18168 Transcript_5709/m.18168 type:complete len:272 (-) Transcript_5709:2061-2876(-)